MTIKRDAFSIKYSINNTQLSFYVTQLLFKYDTMRTYPASSCPYENFVYYLYLFLKEISFFCIPLILLHYTG